MDLIKKIAEKLGPLHDSPESAQTHAWWILQWLTDKTHAQLVAQKEIQLTPVQEEKLADLLSAYINEHKPLQYIFGSVPFLDLKIVVRPPILIPRPETEYWCSLLIDKLRTLKNRKIKILDLCTGTGCIGLSLAKALPQSQVFAIDINPEAIQLAQENSVINNIHNITLLESDIYESLPADLRFDIICANPPYISSSEWEALDPIVKKWEDARALKSEHNGLALIEKIINQAPEWLAANCEFIELTIPQIWIEIGHRQATRVKKILENNGFTRVGVITDLAGKDRVLTAGIPACGFLIDRKT